MAADGNIFGSKGGSSGQPRTPVEAPDSLNSIASAHFLDLLAEGEITGFLSDNPLKDVFLDETPVMNADGSLNFTDVFLDWRLGTQDQDYMMGFPSVSNEVTIGVELKQITAWTRTVSNTDLSAVNVRLSVLALSKTDPTTADINGHSVSYAIDIKTDGGAFVEVFANAFTGKTNNKYERGHRIDLPPAVTDWTIRVRRLTLDTDASNIQDTTFVEAITEIMDLKMRYPNSAYTGLKINAGQFRSIPSRAFRVMGRLMKVPSNYNPVTLAYTGTWDGTFQLAWTRNPAWIFYDLVTQTRFGLGDVVDESQIDKWALYNIAQYCDELVPDGKGSTEPRFTCTIYLQRQEEAYRIIQDLASVFRGISYWGSGAVIPVADMPRDPVCTYTNANVKDGKFSYQGSAKRARHTVCLVSWSDPEAFNRQKVEYVEDEEGIARYGIQTVQITAIGCTSQGQAQRVGNWLLLTERYETDTVTFVVGLDGNLALPGDVIHIADVKRAGRRTGGRVASATTSAITVDFLPVVAIADELICIMPTGIAETRPVSSIVGSTINVSPSFSSAPVVESVWAVSSPTLKTQLYSVISLAEGEGLEAVITALQHEPQKFSAIDNGTKIEPRPIIGTIDPAQTPPTNVVVTASERAGEVIADIVVTCTWVRPIGAESFEVSWRRENGEWTSPQRVHGNQAELFNAFPGAYVCKVTARNGLGVTSIPAVSNTYIVPDPTMLPGFVNELNAAIDGALDDINNIEATLDGVIEFFYQNTAPVIGAGAGQAKEGDVWIDLDDGNHQWRAAAGFWIDAQDDDIVNALLAAIQAQATADGKVKTYFALTAPVHNPPTVILALGDLWFNTTVGVKKLFRWNGSTWNDLISDITMDQLGGLGINLLPDEYSYLDATPLFTTTSFIAVTRDATVSYLGAASIKAVASAAGQYFYLIPPADAVGNIKVTPGKKYLLSFYVCSPTASVGCSAYLYDGAVHFGNYNFVTSATPNVWTRIVIAADLTTSTSVSLSTRLDIPNGATVHSDGAMLEYQLGTQTNPSPYARGMSSGLALLALSRAATAQATADGATVIFRQSLAPSFPPAAIGDYWIDTDDTSYWFSTNGSTWTAVTDPRIVQALADAAAAQATANGRIKTWYQENTPTAATIGDFWYKASVGILYRWDGSVWVNTADNTQAVANPNVVNPGFEQDLTGWTDAVGVGLSGLTVAAPSLTGTKGLVKSGGYAGTKQGLVNDAKITVVPGKVMVCRMTFACNGIADTGVNGVSVGLNFYNSVGAFLSSTNYSTARDVHPNYPGGGWRSFNKAVEVPQDSAYARLAFLVWNYSGAIAYQFDDFQCFEAIEGMSGVNLLRNSDFANGTNNWIGITSIDKNNTDYRANFLASLGSGATALVYQEVDGQVVVGQPYSGQVEVMPTGLTTANSYVRMRIQFTNALNVLIKEQLSLQYFTQATGAPATFEKIMVQNVIAPVGATKMFFVVDATGTATTCPVRKPKLERGAVCTAYTPSVEMNWGTALGTAGSRQRTGDQRNLNQSNVNSYGAVRSAAALTAEHTLGGVKQIHINAHTAYWGGSSATYNQVNSAVTGLVAGTRYVVYCEDAAFQGGTKTWLVVANPSAAMQLGDNMYIAGEVTIPASSGSSGSGGPSGGGYDCVDYDTYLPDGRLLRECIPGLDQILCVNAVTGEDEWVTLKSLTIGYEPCSALIPDGGGGCVIQSNCTPMDLIDGGIAHTKEMLGKKMHVNREGLKSVELCVDVVNMGSRKVLRPDLGNRMFYAGESSRVTIGTHNVMYKP